MDIGFGFLKAIVNFIKNFFIIPKKIKGHENRIAELENAVSTRPHIPTADRIGFKKGIAFHLDPPYEMLCKYCYQNKNILSDFTSQKRLADDSLCCRHCKSVYFLSEHDEWLCRAELGVPSAR